MNRRSKTGLKFALLGIFSLATILVSIGVGSVPLSPRHILSILLGNTTESASLLLDIRIPRTLVAFVVGIALSISGTVMQSVLQNPLASSYTLGVSSGASLGAALIISTGFTLPFLGVLTLPFVGFVFGLLTVLLTIWIAGKIDHGLQNYTIILIGMIISLFVNGLLSVISALFRSTLQQFVLWQMGSFSAKYWEHFVIVGIVTILCVIVLLRYHREMDLMTFGEQPSQTMGVDTTRTKWVLLILCSLLTGTAVCFVGVIGFIDLIAPHLMRRFFGSSHRYILPASALFGGGFMVLCDTVSRIIVPPSGLPVGAVMALIGAPFFLFIFVQSRKQV